MSFKTLHKLVWSYRHELEEWWPTPSIEDSYRFAMCEAGEMLDVLLRQNKAYNRNHHKEMSLGQEAAQTAIMLLTALGERFDWDKQHVIEALSWKTNYQKACDNDYKGTQVDWIGALVSDASQEFLWHQSRNVMGWQGEYCAIQALVELGQMEGIDLTLEITRELERIKEKCIPIK